MKFREIEPIAEQLQIKYAQKKFPNTEIIVNWIIPYPRDENLRIDFHRCFSARVPFSEYFKTMGEFEADIYVIGMDGNWYAMEQLPTLTNNE